MNARRLSVATCALFSCVNCSSAPEQVTVTGVVRGANNAPRAGVVVTTTYMDDRGQLQIVRDSSDATGTFTLTLPPKRFARFSAKLGDLALADHEFVTPQAGELALVGTEGGTGRAIRARDTTSTWGRAFNVLQDHWDERSRDVILMPSAPGTAVVGDTTDDVRVLTEWRQVRDSLLRQVYAARVLQAGVVRLTSREVATMLAEMDSTNALYRMMQLGTLRVKAREAARPVR